MNTVSNSQAPNQHSVQQGAPQFRYGVPPPQQQAFTYDRSASHPQAVTQGFMNIHPDSTVHTTMSNGYTLVDIHSPHYTQQMQQMQGMPQYYPPFPMTAPPGAYQQIPSQQQQQPKAPLQPRKRNILNFVNPDTNSEIELPSKSH